MAKLILASTPDGVIGQNGTLPWRLSSDLVHFKTLTDDLPMIMGRKTYESLPGILPGRLHIVVTSNPNKVTTTGNTIIAPDLESAQRLAASHSKHDGQYFVIGGGTIYERYLNAMENGESNELIDDIDTIWWTRVDVGNKDFDGKLTTIDTSWLERIYQNVTSSEFKGDKFDVKTFEVKKDKRNEYDFSIVQIKI